MCVLVLESTCRQLPEHKTEKFSSPESLQRKKSLKFTRKVTSRACDDELLKITILGNRSAHENDRAMGARASIFFVSQPFSV